MGRKVIGDHNVTGLKLRRELGLDVDVESRSVQRSVKQIGRGHLTKPQLASGSEFRGGVAQFGSETRKRWGGRLRPWHFRFHRGAPTPSLAS